MTYEQANWTFLCLIVVGMFALSGYALVKKHQCEQMAMSQNYSTENIKKLCN